MHKHEQQTSPSMISMTQKANFAIEFEITITLIAVNQLLIRNKSVKLSEHDTHPLFSQNTIIRPLAQRYLWPLLAASRATGNRVLC